jgi:type I restriction enzyme M protein
VAEKKEFQTAHPEGNWTSMDAAKNGTYNKGTVQKRVFDLRSNYQFPDASFEALICEAYRLVNVNKAATSEARRLRKELDQKCIKAIEHLTDKDALMLLELKWGRPLVDKLMAMPAGVIDALADKIKSLEKKYSTTMSEVAARVDAAQRELASLTGELTGDADDLVGIAAWRKELAK